MHLLTYKMLAICLKLGRATIDPMPTDNIKSGLLGVVVVFMHKTAIYSLLKINSCSICSLSA